MGLEFFSLHRKVLEGVAEPTDKRQSNIRIAIGLFIFIIYLLIGAGIYSAMELPAEEEYAKKLKNHIMLFKNQYIKDDCLTGMVRLCITCFPIFCKRSYKKTDGDSFEEEVVIFGCFRLQTVDIRLLGWLALCSVYLVFGAVVYEALESRQEEQYRLKLKQYLHKFRTDHARCLSYESLEQLITKVIHASQRGISASGNVTYAPSWGFAQAFFFSGTLVSTVGYGSSSPVTQGGKAFTIFYCTVGIPLFLVLLSGLVERLKAPSVWFLGKLNSRLGHLYKPSQIQFIHLFIMLVLLLVLLFIIPAAIFMSIEKKWSYLDAFYYCFISLTTIGLGDYTPGDQPLQEYRSVYKIFTTGYLMVGLLCMMLFLATIYDIPQLSLSRFFLLQKEMDESERARLANKMAPGPKYMRQMDETGESQISPASTASQVATEDSYQHY